MVAARQRNEPNVRRDALRKAGNDWVNGTQEVALSVKIRRTLSALPHSKTSAGSSTSGIGRQTRYTGTHVDASQAPSRQSSKTVAMSVDAEVSSNVHREFVQTC